MVAFELSGLHLVNVGQMLLMRLEWLVLTGVLIALSAFLSHRCQATLSPLRSSPPLSTSQPFRLTSGRFDTLKNLSTILRTAAQLGWLAVWYPDTYDFNRTLPNLDHLFAAADSTLFGCQPAIAFSQALPQTLWSEAFNLGYWSYFPMMAVLVLTLFIKCWGTQSDLPVRVAATLITCFFLYYIIYIFLPVAGPQYYFQAVGLDAIQSGHFPALGTYFSSHTEMLPAPGNPDGFFYNLVSASQATGERPTAAFPSSHLGVSTIVLLLAWRHVPRLTWFLMPFWLLLCCATIYIQAHYLVDVIAGFLSVPLILFLAYYIVNIISLTPKR